MTPSRWFSAAVVVGLTAMLASIALDARRAGTTSAANEPLARAVRQLASAVGDAHAAVHAYRAARAIGWWKQSQESKLHDGVVRTDSTFPRALVEPVLEATREQWVRLGAVLTANAEVFVFVDSSAIPRADMVAPRRVIEPDRLVDVSYALPDATDGTRCVVVVRLRGTSPAHVAAMRSQPLTGVCGFYAAFGLPGSRVRAWLSDVDYAFARHSDWDVPRAPVVDGPSVFALGRDGARCLVGVAAACRDALGLSARGRVAPRDGGRAGSLSTGTVLTAASSAREEDRLGNVQGRFLADAVRDLGPERFARFWRDDATPDSAFAATAGVGVETWTASWLERTYGAAARRPAMRTSEVVWLAAALPLLLVVAARPRERLLIETLFRPRR